MEEFGITHQPGRGLHIEGFPDAVKFIRLSGELADRAADLSLHRGDIEFAMRCLDGINAVTGLDHWLKEGLWRSAVVHTFKCFDSTSKSRSPLDREVVFGGDPLKNEVFAYFKHLRNKHLVHDENAYSQSLPGAVLNGPGHAAKIARIITVGMASGTLEESNYSNLRLLCEEALAWVQAEYESVCAKLAAALESVPHADLLKMDEVTFTVPTPDQIGDRRSRG